jgi:hypothetical protein
LIRGALVNNGAGAGDHIVIASETAIQNLAAEAFWIASSRSLSSGHAFARTR